MPLVEIATAVGVFVIVVLAAVIRSYKHPDGIIHQVVNDRSTATTAHEEIPEIKDTLDEVHSEVKDTKNHVETLEDRVDQGFRTLALFHKDNERVDREEIKDRLDIDSFDDEVFEDSDTRSADRWRADADDTS